MSAWSWIEPSLEALRDAALMRARRQWTPRPGGRCEVDGRLLVNFASNDYLGLAHDPRVIEAACRAARDAGVGAGASALVTGRTDWHARLEEALARFEDQPAAMLFPTGYAANVGTIGALTGPNDEVWCDRDNHASLIDGCRLSGAKFRVYRHDELDLFAKRLERPTLARRRLIVTDSVFSMDGDIAPLPALCDLAERHDAMLLVDEAHATGVLGEHGRGAAEALGVEGRAMVRVGTLSKALGSLGGFVTGPKELVDWLWNAARPQIFSTALPPACCAAALAALEIVQSEPERRRVLHEHSRRLRETLRAAGLMIPTGVDGPIIPVILKDPARAVAVAAEIERRGFVVGAIRPPTVPQGTSRLRITVGAAHTVEDIDRLASAVIEAAATSVT